MTSSDPVVDAYDAARPGYPESVFDALERIVRAEFGSGPVRCGYETWL